MEITLVRHGRPAFKLKGWALSRDLPLIVEQYNTSPIEGEPSQETVQQTAPYAAVVCSDLERSLSSARALGKDSILLSDPLFREFEIPHFSSGYIVLPIILWRLLMRLLSGMGFSRNGESLAMIKKRAVLAADRLVTLAEEHGQVLLVGHAYINYFIAKELLSRKWQGPARPGMAYWETAMYTFSERNR